MNEYSRDSEQVGLSEEGQHRRAEILRLAQGVARARHHRRVARHVAVVALLFVGMFVSTRPRRSISPPIVKRTETMHPATIASSQGELKKPSPQVVVTRIETDETLLSRWAIGPRKPAWEVLNDDDLLRRLAEGGRPAGLAYVDGVAMLLFREPGGR